MLLKILNSNSDGNCMILKSAEEQLMLDCGVDYKSTMIGLDFNIRNLSGILATHHHIDHIRSIDKFANKGIPTIMPFADDCKHYSLKKGSKFKAKTFALKTVDGNWAHSNGDGSPCEVYGYCITHPELGVLVYATDCSVIKYKFPGVNHLLIEANYDLDKLEDDGDIKKNHVFSGHQSIQAACKFIEANNSDRLKNVILCHLSQENGDPLEFTEKVANVFKKNIYVAQKGMIIDL